MPLNIEAMRCPVRLLGERESGKRGVIGTGFFVTVPSETDPNRLFPYLVTAHHVLEDQNTVEMQVPHPILPGRLSPPVVVADWQQPLPRVDLAVAALRYPFPVSMIGIRLDTHVLPDQSGLLVPGSTFFYVGVLVPADRVMVRSGTIGALDQRGLNLKRSHQDYAYTAHLLDCRSYEGFSGSPCFGEVPVAELKPLESLPYPMPEGTGPWGDVRTIGLLCGMFTAHLNRTGDDDAVSRFGVGVMLRSEEIRKALMTDELRKDRAERDAAGEAQEAEEVPRFQQAGARGEGSEFENFEELTRKLVNTPKGEVDEKRKAEKKKP
jgi:hypothetical protein